MCCGELAYTCCRGAVLLSGVNSVLSVELWRVKRVVLLSGVAGVILVFFVFNFGG